MKYEEYITKKEHKLFNPAVILSASYGGGGVITK